MTNPPSQTESAQAKDDPIDYIYGAREIARFLKVSLRTIYYFMELKKVGKGHIPIENRRGFGLCASRQALLDYMKGGH